jgi:hypothetical protein
MADQADNTQSGTAETVAETRRSPGEFAKFWLQAIQLASDDEGDWRKDAEEALKRFRTGKKQGFNILYANTQTTVPALYNSPPAPDVRRRFDLITPQPPQSQPQPQPQPGMPPPPPDPQAQMAMQAYQAQVAQAKQGQEDGKQVCTAIERAISVASELYNFDGVMQAAVLDRQLPGRGVTRARICMGAAGSKWVECEQVQWDDFRHGPGKTFKDWPWVAFRHRQTREELVKLAGPVIGQEVKLDAQVGDTPAKNTDSLPDSFKRALTWEVWDKEERKVYWFAESYKDAPLAEQPDPYELREFLPIPEPLYQVRVPDSTTPICEFRLWKQLADEVDSITTRIIGLIRVLKAKGLYDGAFASIVEKLKSLDDGELAAADDAGRSMAQGGIDKAIWMWPVDAIVKVVESLYEARERAKNALYEFTGVADIMRGQTEPSETLGAQRIKAQWGSLRLQKGQADVQRYARDLFRLMADLLAYAWEPAEWQAVTGVQLTPAQFKLIKSDLQREFAIEIETDSTIRADLSRAQENISGFVTGLGAFMTAVGPAVAEGFMPPDIAVKYISAFARNFKLGREAEDLGDEWVKWLEDKAQNPQPPKPDPKVQAEQIKAATIAQQSQARVQETQVKAQAKVQEIQVKAQATAQQTQLDTQAAIAEFQMEMKQLETKMQAFLAEHAAGMQTRRADAALAAGDHMLQADSQARQGQAAERGHEIALEGLEAKRRAQQQPNGGDR